MSIVVANVMDFGAKGNGTTDNTQSVIDAKNSDPNAIILFPVNDIHGEDYLIDGNVTMDAGHVIGIHPSVTLFGTGTFMVDRPEAIQTDKAHKFIDPFGILFSNPGVVQPEWFGAIGDGVVDNLIAFQTAINSFGLTFGTLELQYGAVYFFTGGNLTIPTNVGIGGHGKFKPDSGMIVNWLGPDETVNHASYDESGGGGFVLDPVLETRWNARKPQQVFSNAAVVDIDLKDGGVLYHTLTENTFAGVPMNPVDGEIITFHITQPAAGIFTFGFSATTYKFAGNVFTMTPSGGSIVRDSISFVYNKALMFYIEVGRSQNMV